ncbi:MAG: dUTP diphosphatase [Planctomycetota bacterium]
MNTPPPSTPRLQIRRIDPDVPLPNYHSDLAAGLDLHAALPREALAWTLSPGEIRLIPCGFAMAVPMGYEAQVRPRSGLATRFGISMPNAPGTIDADYRGPVMVPLINLGRHDFQVERHMRIAQMVIAPVARIRLEEVEQLDETPRGSDGFGSTGW